MGWVNDNSSYFTNKQQEEIDYNYLINNKDKKKRNIKTAVPRRSRTGDRPTAIIQKKEIGKSMKTFKDDINNDTIDQTTQKFVLNEDLLAEISYRISMIPLAEKDTDVSLKDTTVLDVTSDDQIIMNLKKLDNLDKSNISLNNKEMQNTSGETKQDLLNYSQFQISNNWKSKGIIRKESEDSFIKMCNPRSSMIMSNHSKRLNTSQTNYSKASKNYNTGVQREIKVEQSFKKKRPVTTQSFRPQKRNFHLPKTNAIKDSSFYGSVTSANANLM